jgi:DNA primase
VSLFTPDTIDRVRESADIVEVVSAYTDLRRQGERFVGLCPFHEERTPSFSVKPAEGFYYCFGCEAGGDTIRFVQEKEGLAFPDAVEALADRFGVEVEREAEDPEAEAKRRRRGRLGEALERAAAFYEAYLWDADKAARARAYLAERGLREEILRAFGVGFAPSTWDSILLRGQRAGFSVEELMAAGLVQKGQKGGHYDVFRSRITFPVRDVRGRTVGFGARASLPDQKPKYKNSAEGELYRKSRTLYGIDRARGPIARSERAVVVEGYTDVLALHQAGVREAVAIMGTAVTPDQIIQLGQAAPSIYFALDADSAGQEAMARAARVADDRGLEMRVVALPPGSDPADLVGRDGADAFMELLQGAISVPQFEVKRALAAADLATPGGRDDALSAVVPVIRSLPRGSATYDALVRYVSDKLDADPKYLETLLSAPRAPEMSQRIPDSGTVGVPHTSRLPSIEAAASTERAFLAMSLAHGQAGRRYLDALHDDHFSSPPLRHVRDHLVAHFDDPLAELPEDEALAGLITQVAFLADDQPASESVLRLTFLQLELRRTERRLRHAAESADYDIQRALWPQREGLRREIDELMGQTQ